MKRYLLFDSGCSLCTQLAEKIVQESDSKLEARSLRETSVQEMLNTARPNWQWEPMLLEASSENMKVFSGPKMAFRLVQKLGVRRAWKIAWLVRGTGAPLLGVNINTDRRRLLQGAGGLLTSLFLAGTRFKQGSAQEGSVYLPLIQSGQGLDLQPGVPELIANTFMAHAAEFPDPNETVEVLRLYMEGNNLLLEEQVEEALTIFEQAVEFQPDSRHALAGVGRALTAKYHQTNNEDDLRAAAQKFIEASEVGAQYSRLAYTSNIAHRLADLGEEDQLHEFFSKHMESPYRPTRFYLHYAQGLVKLGNPAAGKWFQKALLSDPTDLEVLIPYVEWLLDNQQFEQALQYLSEDSPYESLHLYRGFALERLEKVELAEQSYEKHAPFSKLFAAPQRFKTENPLTQNSIRFESDAAAKEPLAIQQTCLTNISQCIHCEAESENDGAKRTVGWTIRNRVFVHTTSNPCRNFLLSGSSTCDKYISAINGGFCRGRDRNGDNIFDTTTASNQAASDVYYGRTPEPKTKWCPRNPPFFVTDDCNVCNPVTCRCTQGSDQWVSGGRSDGYLFMLATSGNCSPTTPSSPCAKNPDKKCANGGYENCFYTI